MQIIHTDAADPDFRILSGELERHFDDLAGGRDKRSRYAPLNALANIKDAFIAYENGRPVGCVSFKEYGPGLAEVKRMFVKPEYRGRKIARELMKALEAEAARQSYSGLILETGRAFTAAVELYKNLSFEVIENYGPYADMPASVCFRKMMR